MCAPTETFLLGLGSPSIVGRSSTCVMPALSTYIGEELAKKAAHAKGRIKAYEMRAKMRGEQAVFRRLKKRRLAQGNCLLIDFASWGFESSVKKSQKQLGASRLAGSVVFNIFFFLSLSLSRGPVLPCDRAAGVTQEAKALAGAHPRFVLIRCKSCIATPRCSQALAYCSQSFTSASDSRQATG